MTKIRARLRWLRQQWLILWYGTRYPLRRKSAWINVTVWSIALATVGLALTANAIVRDFSWSWWNILVGAFDFIMLHRSVEGLLWFRGVERQRKVELRRAGGPQGE